VTRFRGPLASGDLVFADNINTQKIHLVPVTRCAFDDDVAALSKHLTKKSREKAVAEIADYRREIWAGTALCGVEGTRATFGNYTTYYWSPRENPSMETVCQGCLARWRKNGEPEIKGFDRSGSADDPWPWPLPFGWREVPKDSHPWDVATDQPIENVKDDTGRVRGEHRVEIRRWTRGKRIVRLVHHTDTDTYAARSWVVGADADEENWWTRGPLKYAQEHCQKYMAIGGY
jgi:hypothetical protein